MHVKALFGLDMSSIMQAILTITVTNLFPYRHC